MVFKVCSNIIRDVACRRLGTGTVACGIAVATLGCGSGAEPTLPTPNLACVLVTGTGTTEGDRNRLRGYGVFHFGDEERTGEVGLYLFDITPADNDGLHVDTRYQFHWDNGDSFLTRDLVYFEPTFVENTYRFAAPMYITAGSGVFSELVGEKPLKIAAEMQFGPPDTTGGVMTAIETFQVGGTVCQ